MYIGLIDDDLRFKKWYPNLELMKLASFHKFNRDIVELCTDYTKYERYSKIYFRKNLINHDIPDKFISLARNRCDYGGYSFTNGIYIPMEKEIEESLPDVTIYDKIKKEIKSDAKVWLKKDLIRLQTHGTIVPQTARSTFLVYDKVAAEQPKYEELLSVAETIEFIEEQHFESVAAAVKFACEHKHMSNTHIECKETINKTMAQQIKDENYKNYIYFPFIPEKYKDCSFFVAAGIINTYIEEMISLVKICPYIRFINPFSDTWASYLITAINQNRTATNIRFFFNKKNDYWTILNAAYPNLLTKIEYLRRERNERKNNSTRN